MSERTRAQVVRDGYSQEAETIHPLLAPASSPAECLLCVIDGQLQHSCTHARTQAHTLTLSTFIQANGMQVFEVMRDNLSSVTPLIFLTPTVQIYVLYHFRRYKKELLFWIDLCTLRQKQVQTGAWTSCQAAGSTLSCGLLLIENIDLRTSGLTRSSPIRPDQIQSPPASCKDLRLSGLDVGWRCEKQRSSSRGASSFSTITQLDRRNSHYWNVEYFYLRCASSHRPRQRIYQFSELCNVLEVFSYFPTVGQSQLDRSQGT